MPQNAKEKSPLAVDEIHKIFDAINARTGGGVDRGAGSYVLTSTVERLHGLLHMPGSMADHVFDRHANEAGMLADIDAAVAFVRDIEGMHGIGLVEDAREVARQRDALLKMLNWVSDECKVYPETTDETAFAQRLLTAIHHPKSGVAAVAGKAVVAGKAALMDSPPSAPAVSSGYRADPAGGLLHALDIVESLADGNDAKDLPQIAMTARIAMREYRRQKSAEDAEKASRDQSANKAVAKLSERLADAYVLIQDASACIRATTHWSDLEALQHKLNDAVKAYRSTPEQGAQAPSAPTPRGRPRM